VLVPGGCLGTAGRELLVGAPYTARGLRTVARAGELAARDGVRLSVGLVPPRYSLAWHLVPDDLVNFWYDYELSALFDLNALLTPGGVRWSMALVRTVRDVRELATERTGLVVLDPALLLPGLRHRGARRFARRVGVTVGVPRLTEAPPPVHRRRSDAILPKTSRRLPGAKDDPGGGDA